MYYTHWSSVLFKKSNELLSKNVPIHNLQDLELVKSYFIKFWL